MNHRTLIKALACAAAMQFWASMAYGADAPHPEFLAQRFVEAWNAHTPRTFTAEMDPDVEWIQARGEKVRGKSEVESYLGREHETWARQTTMSALDVESRLLCADIALVALSWQISSDTDPAFRGMTQFIARKVDSRWVVIGGQVTSGRGSRSTTG